MLGAVVVNDGGQAESIRPDHLEGLMGLVVTGAVVTGARWVVSAAALAGVVSLAACSSQLDVRGGGGQPSIPSLIVVDFKVGVPPRQANAEVKRCHPIAIMGSDTTRSHGRPATSIFVYGPESGTAGASALYKCLKSAPGVVDQNWTG